jgi:methylenetetrahydrofolate--tRNA-(uracil-5-)-methyltransferase
MGALIGHITGGHIDAGKGSFQPMNINYGLLPPLDEAGPKRREDGSRIGAKERGRNKKLAMGERALADLDAWLAEAQALAAE